MEGMCLRRLLFLTLLFHSFLAAQDDDLFFLRVVYPANDTTKVSGSRYRIAASTSPTARAFINWKETKVYPSGAFVGLITDVKPGKTPVRLTVKNERGDSLYKDFVLVREEGLTTSPIDEVVIEKTLMQPAQDLWLTAGDILELRMKGTPGEEPYADIEGVVMDIPMYELPPAQAWGVKGVYTGRYKVQEEDQCIDVPVRFHIRKNIFSSEEAFSRGKISIIQDSLPRTAEISGDRPFLNAGLGTDRLGGTKLGTLVEGVRVLITGKVGDQYKVKLSYDMEGWLPQEYARLLPLDTPAPTTLTSTISVEGDSSEDFVRVALDQKVPYTSEQVPDPTAIVVDIFGATSNTNWITQQLSAAGIRQVKCTQVAEDHYQLTIYLKYRQHWGYDISYEGTTMKIRVRRPPVIVDSVNVLSNLLIAIDAGHGMGNRGALGATGVIEKDITLAIAGEVNAQLQAKQIKTIVTRDNDDNVAISDRIDKILSSGAHLLVSIHCNSVGEASDPELIKGTSAYYRYPGFKTLSEIMYAKMLSLGFAEWGITGNFNFSLNGLTQLPNVLVETGFLSNPEDEMRLIDPGLQKQIAAKIVEGLEEFVRTYAKR